MHPRERILGLMLLHEQRGEQLPDDLRSEAKRWKVQVPASFDNITDDNAQNQKERLRNE